MIADDRRSGPRTCFKFDFHPGPRPPHAPRLQGRWPDAPRAWRTTRGHPPLRAREALQGRARAREVRPRIRRREPLLEALRSPTPACTHGTPSLMPSALAVLRLPTASLRGWGGRQCPCPPLSSHVLRPCARSCPRRADRQLGAAQGSRLRRSRWRPGASHPSIGPPSCRPCSVGAVAPVNPPYLPPPLTLLRRLCAPALAVAIRCSLEEIQ
jgi:hypothetical protein